MKDETKLKDMTNFLENVYKDIKEQPTIEEEQKQEKEFISKIKGNNTNEIKEIKVNKASKSITFINNGIGFSQLGIADEILDLITNLQDQVKGIREERNYLFNKLSTENKYLQEENERVSNLYKTYEEANDLWIEKNKNLQQRIDKATEYINHEWFKREQIGIAPLQFSYEELQNVLDILRGDE